MSEWKQCAQLYAAVMAGRHTDIMHDGEVVDEGVVKDSSIRKYVESATFPLLQPSKSRVVALVYATMLSRDYGIPLLDALNDPDLLKDDPFFVPLKQDATGYALAMFVLGPFDEWKNKPGWVIRTRQYYWLECTEAGGNFIASATDEELQAFFDSNVVPE